MILSSVAALLVLGALTTLSAGIAQAQPTPRKTPHHAQPATAAHSAPDPTATIAKPEAATPPVDEEALPTPYDLPKASRARMRACGLKWQQMKMSGKAGDEIWRDFATTCLGAISDPDLEPDRTAQQTDRPSP